MWHGFFHCRTHLPYRSASKLMQNSPTWNKRPPRNLVQPFPNAQVQGSSAGSSSRCTVSMSCPLSHLWLLSESLKLHQLLQMTQLQRSGATYCDEPADKEQFAAFLEAYDEESRQEEARLILASNTFMADLHSRLVPLVISDDTFWQRYFFRCGL